MKRLLILALFLTPTLAFAQYENIKIENSQIVFDKVYQVDSMDADQVKSFLIAAIPGLSLSKPVISDEVITAVIDKADLDHQKYGKWPNTPVFIVYPMTADVALFWKDGKYRVQISNIYFDVGSIGKMELTKMLTRKGELEKNKNLVKAGVFLDNYFADWFTIKKDKTDW